MWWLEDRVGEFILPFYHVAPMDQIQVVRLGGKCLSDGAISISPGESPSPVGALFMLGMRTHMYPKLRFFD